MSIGSALLLEHQLDRLADDMSVGLIMTPWQNVVSIAVNEPVREARRLMAGGFDQLPVLSGGGLAGMLTTDSLTGVPDEQPVSPLTIPLSKFFTLSIQETIESAVRHFVDHRVLLAFDPSSGRFAGLLHFSDLNRQAVRILIYLRLSALEMGLAEYLRRFHPSLDEWLEYVPVEKQPALLGSYELQKRKGVELSPVEGAYLTDLLAVFRKMPGLLDRLGMPKKQFVERADAINDFRHSVMHPVRALVRAHQDVQKFAEQLNQLEELTQATLRLLHSTPSTPAVEGPPAVESVT